MRNSVTSTEWDDHSSGGYEDFEIRVSISVFRDKDAIAERREATRVKEDEENADEVGELIGVESLGRLGSVLDQDPQRMIKVQDPAGAVKSFSPLMYAVYRGRVKTVAFLLERDANVSARSVHDESVLGVACSAGCPHIAQLLLSHGAMLDLSDHGDTSALDKAFDYKHARFLECVFSRGGVKYDTVVNDHRYAWLAQACEMPSLTLVRCLLDQGLDINAAARPVTPLMLACELGEVAIVRELVERGADIDLMRRDNTAIIYACSKCHRESSTIARVIKAIKYLIDRGAQVDTATSNGSTALMVAAETSQTWAVRCLLDAGAKVDLRDESGCTALMWACVQSRAEAVELLLRAGARADLREQVSGQTALMLASMGNVHVFSDDARTGTVELLLDSGVDLNAQDTQGFTALIRAAEIGNLRVVQELLARGAEVDLRAEDDQTALMRCCDYGSASTFGALHGVAKELAADPSFARAQIQKQETARERIAIELLEHGAQVNLQDKQGLTNLMLACREASEEFIDEKWVRHTLPNQAGKLAPHTFGQSGRSDGARTIIVRELLHRGADANLRDQHGYTALMHAVFRGKAEVARLLLGNGAAVDLRDGQGSTALRKAIQSKRSSITSLLVDHGASVDLKDSDGTTLLMLAAKTDDFQVAEALLKSHAATNIQDGTGKTALMWGAQRAGANLCQLLIDHGADVELRAEDGATVLMKVAECGNTDYMMCILAALAKADARRSSDTMEDLRSRRQNLLDQQNKDGKTALMLAVARGHKMAAKALLEHDATVRKVQHNGDQTTVGSGPHHRGSGLNLQDRHGYTALMHAVFRGDAEMARLLLDHGAAVNLRDCRGSTALRKAIQSKRSSITSLLVDHGASVDLKDSDGTTLLMLAAKTDDFQVAEALLKLHAATNIQDGTGKTALMWAAERAGANLCQLLIDHGADMELRAKDGSTALLAAVERNDLKCMKCLLAAHAPQNWEQDDGPTSSSRPRDQQQSTLNQQNRSGMTALMLAVAKGNISTVKALLHAGAAVNTQNKDGTTPLMLAAWRADKGLARFLLEDENVLLDLQQTDGSTALMLACARKDYDLANLLVARGANTNLRDASGRTALRIVANHPAQARGGARLIIARKAWEAAKMLVDGDAELEFSHIPSIKARAVLVLTFRRGYMEIIELLSDEYCTRSGAAGGAGSSEGARKRRKTRELP